AAPLAVPAGSATATFLPEGTAYTPAAPLTVASFQFEIPADTASYDVTSGCTVPFDMQHVFSIFPHMHNYGRSVTISTAATDGGPWAQLFEHGWTPGIQQIYPLATSIDAGTQLQIDCNYANSTDVPVPATQTAEGEMCLAVLYYWPAQSPAYACGF
ncbi:MAG TPA: hypothetical protein VMB50_05345, partial [Myxococcales bacterium]|nr:hypothetical protein [Myxococcales bacterium]